MEKSVEKYTRGMGMRQKISGVITGLLILCIALAGFGIPAYSNDNISRSARVTIKVAFYQLDGFFEYDENGNECGYGVDYLNELSKYANIEWEYVPADSWEGIKQMLKDGTVDVRMPGSEPISPSTDYDYTTEPIMMTYHAIMTLKDRDDLYYQDYENIDKMKIAAVTSLIEKTGVSDYLQSIGVFDNIVYFDDYNSCRDALDNGTVDGVISNIMDLTDDMKVLDKFSVVNNYITTLKGNQYYTIINNAMTQLKLENPSFQADLYEKYYPERVSEPFTKSESMYIAGKDYLTVAVYTDRKPVSYYDEKTNSYKGVAIEAANLISKRIGIPFKYISITTKDRLDMLDYADVIMPVSKNADSEKYFVTDSFLDSEILMAVRTNNENLSEGDRVGVLSSTPGIKEAIDNGKFDIIEYKSNKDALNALQKGKIDGFANSSYVLNWILENPKYSELTSLHYQSIPLPFEFSGKADDVVLKSILNKGIHSILDDEIETIVREGCRFSMDDLSFGDKLIIYRQQIIISILIILIIFTTVFLYNHSRTKYIQKIKEGGRQQELANKSKTEFLSRMSHDMRTPLNVIIGMEQLAEENNNPDDTNLCLSKINIASEFLLGLINDVLDMEHIESGKMILHMAPYSGEEFVQYIESVILPLCQQKNIHFSYSTDGVKDFIVMQDKLRTNQIYFNLLSNAVKYTQEGGSVIFHTHVEKIENNRIRMNVSISDTGIGMSEEFQKHMFEPFSQENQELKPVGEGTGLGLSIVKKICDMMNMEISVQSELGKGTTFYLKGEYDIATEADIVKISNTETEYSEDALKNKTVLVCEDHPLNQEIIQRLLAKKGVIVSTADNGKRGIEAFERSAPGDFDAILMDIRMPVMDGIAATKIIRSLSRPDAKSIPIIALTANAYDEDIKNCIDAGMNYHIAKPVDASTLYRILAEQIKNI